MSSPKSQIFVTKLPHKVTEEDIRGLFSPYGAIASVSMKRSYCFVSYEDESVADEAIKECNGRTLHGAELVVERATSDRKRSKNPNGPKPDDECRKCGELGHWQNSCPSSSRRYRRRRSYSDSSRSRSRSRSRSNRKKEKRSHRDRDSKKDRKRGRSSSESSRRRSRSSSRSERKKPRRKSSRSEEKKRRSGRDKHKSR